MRPIVPMVIAGAIVIVAGILMILFRNRMVGGLARFYDTVIRDMGQDPETKPQLNPLTNGSAILWGVGVSTGGVLMILAGLFRWL